MTVTVFVAVTVSISATVTVGVSVLGADMRSWIASYCYDDSTLDGRQVHDRRCAINLAGLQMFSVLGCRDSCLSLVLSCRDSCLSYPQFAPHSGNFICFYPSLCMALWLDNLHVRRSPRTIRRRRVWARDFLQNQSYSLNCNCLRMGDGAGP